MRIPRVHLQRCFLQCNACKRRRIRILTWIQFYHWYFKWGFGLIIAGQGPNFTGLIILLKRQFNNNKKVIFQNIIFIDVYQCLIWRILILTYVLQFLLWFSRFHLKFQWACCTSPTLFPDKHNLLTTWLTNKKHF